jgi:WD40 repeat protein
MCFSPDGCFLAVAGTSSLGPEGVRFVETKKWTVARTLRDDSALTVGGIPLVICAIAFSPDGMLLAAAGGRLWHEERRITGSVKLWDVATGTEVRTIRGDPWGDPGALTFAAFSPDSTRLVSGAWNFEVWDVATGKGTHCPAGHPGRVTCALFSPDGTLLASAGQDTSVRLWDLVTGSEVRVLTGHSGDVTSLAFSPDGRVVASGAFDRPPVRLWDVATGETVRTLDGWAVTSIAFSPDGKSLAAANGQEVGLWDTRTGAKMRTLRGHVDAVAAVAFSPNGRVLAARSQDGLLRLWRVN